MYGPTDASTCHLTHATAKHDSTARNSADSVRLEKREWYARLVVWLPPPHLI
jgi:hypothetical protein